ncbi:MAG: 4Fe-4S binding protein [Bacteroidales bacterium]|jgi:ferredoxin|nr:4Fe-4S binding protein [Bacteroidales bacterium]
MQAYLKPVRVVISIAMLVAVGFLFLDFSSSIPSFWFRTLTWLQFVPSLISFLTTLGHGLAITAYGFLVILLLTLLFGRVYCSYICPLGIFQDVVSWISKKTKKKKFRFRFAPPKSWLRYSILIIVCLSLLTGSIFLVNLLDPYSNFGRFMSDFFKPLYTVGNNLLVKIFEAAGSYALYPVKIVMADPYALVVPALMLVLVIWFSFRKGRLYCNAVCPVGTLLGLVSKVSLFKIKIDESGCNQCGKCMFACKSQCIDVKQQKIDFSRCVGCGNCLSACDRNSIRYSLATPKKSKIEQTDQSKRRFVAGSLLLMAAFSGLSIKAFSQKKNKNKGEKGSGIGTGNQEVIRAHTVCPPGSLGLDHFTTTCTACHLCVSACPTGVLKPSFLEYGFFGMMQPYMDYQASFCNFECVKCTEVCPNKAILPLTKEEKIITQIGVVRFIKQNCIVYTDETSCGSCSEHCPTQAVKMVPYKGELTIPEVNPDICVGCGACEYACPVTPYKAIIVDGCEKHQVAQKPKEEALEEKPLEDFPF